MVDNFTMTMVEIAFVSAFIYSVFISKLPQRFMRTMTSEDVNKLMIIIIKIFIPLVLMPSVIVILPALIYALIQEYRLYGDIFILRRR